MPFEIDIDASRGLATVVYHSEVHRSDLEAVRHWFTGYAEDHPGLVVLADFRNCRLDLSAADVRALANSARNGFGATGCKKWAIVASDDFVYGMGRMFEALRSDEAVETGVFRDVEEATAWLRRPPCPPKDRTLPSIR